MEVTLSRKQVVAFAGIIFVVGACVGMFLSGTFKGPWPAPGPAPSDNAEPIPTPRDLNLAPAVTKLLPPSGPQVEGLSLPAPTEMIDPPQTIPIIAKTKGETVRWLVLGSDASNQPKADLIPSLKMLLLHPARKPDGSVADSQITIFAYTAIDGVPTEPAMTVLVVKSKDGPKPNPKPNPKPDPKPDPEPDPKPDADPTPTPKAKPAHVTFIFDYQKPTMTQTTIRNDAMFRARLKELGVEYHEMSVQSAELKKTGGLQRYVDRHGVPVVVIQDKVGNVLDDAKFIDAKTTLLKIEALHGGR